MGDAADSLALPVRRPDEPAARLVPVPAVRLRPAHSQFPVLRRPQLRAVRAPSPVYLPERLAQEAAAAEVVVAAVAATRRKTKSSA